MRKIKLAIYVSLDGVVQDPAWTAPFWNDQLATLQSDYLFASDALLLGRVTYQGFAAAWPSMTDGAAARMFGGKEATRFDAAGFADRMNSLPKYVASTTLEAAEWNANVIKGDVADEVARLKQQPGQDILMYGSANFADTLREHGLIDEYRLWVYPVVRGSGKRLFKEGGDPAALTLMDTKTFGSGVVLLAYCLVQSE